MEKKLSDIIAKGNEKFKNQEYKNALKYYLEAFKFDAENKYINFNIANIFFIFKNYSEAIKYAKLVKSKKSAYLLAEIYFAQKDYDMAIKYYEALYNHHEEDAWIAGYLSQSYEQIGDINKAIGYGFKALELAPNDENQHINFGYLLYESNHHEAAKKWLKKYPDNPIAHHMGNAILGNQKISNSNSDYIKNIFDIFSSDFDSILKNLDYLAPEYIAEYCASIPLKKAKILDAGCGTGLCGKFLKKHSCRGGLEGVDISGQMLEIANKKCFYNHLIEDDMIDFLQSKTEYYDAIISCDVLTYFGALEDVFFAIKNSLKNFGFFIFTISQNYIDDSPYFLHPSGRFVHSQNYVENTLKTAGFEIQKIELKKLRNEGEKDVFGWVTLAMKKAS